MTNSFVYRLVSCWAIVSFLACSSAGAPTITATWCDGDHQSSATPFWVGANMIYIVGENQGDTDTDPTHPNTTPAEPAGIYDLTPEDGFRWGGGINDDGAFIMEVQGWREDSAGLHYPADENWFEDSWWTSEM